MPYLYLMITFSKGHLSTKELTGFIKEFNSFQPNCQKGPGTEKV